MRLTIHNATLDSTLEPVNVGISGGRIEVIQAESLPPGETALEAGGAMLSPAFIDPHFHLDNALLWDHKNQSGTLREAIEVVARIKDKFDVASIVNRSSAALRLAIANGTLWMRNHCDVDQIAKLQLLQGVLAAREKFKEAIDIQIVAFPQLGLADNPESVDLMWQAMAAGADVVGGIPHGEKDMDAAARHIEIAFEIAQAHDADVDMHVDETDDPYWHSLELLAEKTIDVGYQGRVTAGHCCAMAGWDDKLAARVIDKVREARVNIVTNAPVNLFVQGREGGQPRRRGIARVAELLAAGVNVSCGQDDMKNMFYPFGRMDMLEVANFVAHAAHLSSPEQIQAAFDMPRYRAAQVLRLEGYGISVGGPANLVLIAAGSALDAIRCQPERSAVIRHGEILARNEWRTEFAPAIPR